MIFLVRPPARKNNNAIHSGRPSGGLAFIWDIKLSKFIEKISCPNSSQAKGVKLKLKLDNSTFVFINPC